MPTYEYKCLQCQRRFEVFQNITEPRLEKCDQCGGVLKRLVGAGAGLLFKGTGFYSTDYRSDRYKQAEKRDKPSSSTAGSSTTPSEKKSSTSTAASTEASKT